MCPLVTHRFQTWHTHVLLQMHDSDIHKLTTKVVSQCPLAHICVQMHKVDVHEFKVNRHPIAHKLMQTRCEQALYPPDQSDVKMTLSCQLAWTKQNKMTLKQPQPQTLVLKITLTYPDTKCRCWRWHGQIKYLQHKYDKRHRHNN